MATHILVPVDQSERSTDALEFALSEYPGARITALHVIGTGDLTAGAANEAYAAVYQDQVLEQLQAEAERTLANAERVAAEHDVEIATETTIGNVKRSIVNYAEDNDVDHIVIGSHGRTGASRVLLGSVAEAVARRSPIPVTIVR